VKAIVKAAAAPGLSFEEVPIPKIKSDEVLIQPLKTAICGTDIHIYKWDAWAQKTVPVPLVIGHEFMGKVVEIGADVKGISIGDKVSGEGHITCGICPNCLSGKSHLCPETEVIGIHRHGCFAEFFPFKARNIFPVPNGIPDDIAAIFDPLGNAVHTAMSFDLRGKDVLITGAGPIGIMAVAIAKHMGASKVVITDVNDTRLSLAEELGADQTINVTKSTLNHEKFSIAFEMSGSPQALIQSLESLKPGGQIGLLGLLPPGITIDWDLVIFKMLTLKGIYGRQMFATWKQMTKMLHEGLNIAPVITHKFPAEEFEKAFNVMMQGKSGKVILEWTQEEAVILDDEYLEKQTA